MSRRRRNIWSIAALLVFLAALGGLWLRTELESRKWDRAFEKRAPAGPSSPGGRSLTLLEALAQDRVSVEIRGTSTGPLTLDLTNTGSGVIAVSVPAGQLFLSREQDAEAVAVIPQRIILQSGETQTRELPAVAASFLNEPGPKTWLVSLRRDPALAPLLTHLETHAATPKIEVLQAAVLLARENLPLALLADFPLLTQDRPTALSDQARQVPTAHLVQALVLLRDAGYRVDQFAILIDPQFRLEAMLDPAARPEARRLFGIAETKEWTFWKNQLEHGHNSIRHRALLGIARYYPDVAVRMLPKWARFENISFRFRQAALQGLAEIGTAEAGAVLNKLRWEFRDGHLLETAASQALVMHEQYRENPLVPRAPQTRPRQAESAATPVAVASREPDLPRQPGSTSPPSQIPEAAPAENAPPAPPSLAQVAEQPESAPEEPVSPATIEEDSLDFVALAEMFATGQTPDLEAALASSEKTAVPEAHPDGDTPAEDSVALADNPAASPEPTATEPTAKSERERAIEVQPEIDLAENAPANTGQSEEDDIDLVAFAEALAEGNELPEEAEAFLDGDTTVTLTTDTTADPTATATDPQALPQPAVEETGQLYPSIAPEEAALELLDSLSPGKAADPVPDPRAEARRILLQLPAAALPHMPGPLFDWPQTSLATGQGNAVVLENG